MYDKKTLTEGLYFNIMKAIYAQPTANIILNGEKLKAFPLRSRNKAEIPSLATLIHHCRGSFSQRNQARKGNKRHPNWKGRSKTVTTCR